MTKKIYKQLDLLNINLLFSHLYKYISFGNEKCNITLNIYIHLNLVIYLLKYFIT